MTEHPMQPSPEQFGEWLAEALRQFPAGPSGEIAAHVARNAYAAGADAQLEACKKWIGLAMPDRYVERLHAAMRPKPLSLKRQACDALDAIEGDFNTVGDRAATIRRALESLPDD
jgi:hypothetical protein